MLLFFDLKRTRCKLKPISILIIFICTRKKKQLEINKENRMQQHFFMHDNPEKWEMFWIVQKILTFRFGIL